jgi:TolB-like protein/Flp pilus assembly protein TadD
MEQDEAGTLAAIKARQTEVVEPAVEAHGGRIVKLMGDGVLIEFTSAVNAVEAALQLQARFGAANESLPESRRLRLRIGINLGEVIGDGNDVFGDGVNIAARLEALAAPGGICISAKVHDEIEGKIQARFEDDGEHSLKNLSRPVRTYRLLSESVAPPPRALLELPDRPSIAVLPFVNFSSDPEQSYFADGLTEDLITDLSRNAGLFVIARNSTFAYRGKSLDVRRIASELGVRYLLEGSARRAHDRVRINVQLIDAVNGGHLWAERFDRSLADVFAVQDEIVAKIVEALIGRLTSPPARNRPKSIAAYDLCVRARMLSEQSERDAKEASLIFQEAIALDPGYAEAYRWLALHLLLGWIHYGSENLRPALEAADTAVNLDPNDAGNHWIRGYVLAHHDRWQESDAELATAHELDPNHADSWAIQSDLTTLRGRPLEAIKQLEKAFRLNPYPSSWYLLLLGKAQYAAHQYESAVQTLRREETYRTMSRRYLAASLAQLGRTEEARREAEYFKISNPHFTIGSFARTQPFRDEAALAHFIEGFRKAGLPD